MSTEINNLVKYIKNGAREYYLTGNSYYNDEQFDSMVDQLKTLDPNHPILTTPGWGGLTEDDGKIIHLGKRPVGGLDKIKYPDTHKYFNTPGMASIKLDGLTIVLTSVEGKLIAATRNEGTKGKDCTRHIVEIIKLHTPEFYNNLLKREGIISIRGEVLPNPKSKQWFIDNNITSPRNWCSGLVNRNDVSIEELKHVIFMAYFIRYDNNKIYNSQFLMRVELERIGAHVPVCFLFEHLEPQKLNEFYNSWKDKYNIDGLVISTNLGWEPDSDDYSNNEALSVAYKFESESVQVVVEDVIWNTGPTGRVIPVVKYQPVFLSGAELTYATGFNANFIYENMIATGAIIEITRANEVIPYIKHVIEPANSLQQFYPTHCPSCKFLLEWKGADLVCQSLDCPVKYRSVLNKLFLLCDQPTGVSTATINKWLDNFLVLGTVVEITNIYDFVQQFIQAGPKANTGRMLKLIELYGDHAGKLIHQFEKNIENKFLRGLSFNEFWFILNLPALGESNSLKMGKVDPLSCSMIQIQNSGVNSAVITSLADYQDSWIQLSKYLVAKNIKLIPLQDEKPEILFSVGVTGALSIKRNEWITKVEAKGVKVSGVSKNTKYLVTNEDSNTSKALTAKKLGVQVVTEDEFNQILESLQ
jgi:DNA ligase (NAD+)